MFAIAWRDLRFPPGMNRALFEKSGYMKSFPQLAGTLHSFCGSELDHMCLLQCKEIGDDWTKDQGATDIVLTPAACYPLYAKAALEYCQARWGHWRGGRSQVQETPLRMRCI